MKRKIISMGVVLLVLAITTIQAQVDSRRDPLQATAAPVNWKATPAVVEERKSPEINLRDNSPQQGSTTVSPTPAQPERSQSVKPVSCQNTPGPRTQPPAAKPAEVKSRRDMNGPKTQPAAKKPE